ncbi:MAG: spermidine synthase [Thermodesulfobacteriota bacterium]
MPKPFQIIESIATNEGLLELRGRGEKEFVITVAGRVLMNSRAHQSEAALGRLACGHLGNRTAPRVLVGGLGMGFTLRAVLDHLPASARVTVAELNPAVLDWCRGPLAGLTHAAVDDPRVNVEIGDVALLIRNAARDARTPKYDAIVLDLYNGPYSGVSHQEDPLFGKTALDNARAALAPGGIFAVWGEDYDAGFEKRLRAAGFAVSVSREGRGGPRHVVYLGRMRMDWKRS